MAVNGGLNKAHMPCPHLILPLNDKLYAASGQELRSYDRDGRLLQKFVLRKAFDKTVNVKGNDNYVNCIARVKNTDNIVITGYETKTAYLLDPELKVLRQWTLPKRASAVDSTQDSTILVGDKFGDVYALTEANADDVSTGGAEGPREERIILGDPILGHVSMLVQLAVAEAGGSEYVITADRDEHVRVSQYPKAYVIESFLLGHTEFVSALALTHDQALLASGGGDGWIILWDWQQGKELSRLDVGAAFGVPRGETVVRLLRGGQLNDNAVFYIALDGSRKLAVASVECGALQLRTVAELAANVVDVALAAGCVHVALENGAVVVYDGALAAPVRELAVELDESIEVALFTNHHLRKLRQFA